MQFALKRNLMPVLISNPMYFIWTALLWLSFDSICYNLIVEWFQIW